MTRPTFGKSPVEMNSPFKGDKQEDIENKQPVVSSESPGPNWVKEKGTNQWSYVEPPVVEDEEVVNTDDTYGGNEGSLRELTKSFPPTGDRDLSIEESKFTYDGLTYPNKDVFLDMIGPDHPYWEPELVEEDTDDTYSGSPLEKNEGEYSSFSSKLAGLKIPREEYNKIINWHMMPDGPAKDVYEQKYKDLTPEDHKRFSGSADND